MTGCDASPIRLDRRLATRALKVIRERSYGEFPNEQVRDLAVHFLAIASAIEQGAPAIERELIALLGNALSRSCNIPEPKGSVIVGKWMSRLAGRLLAISEINDTNRNQVQRFVELVGSTCPNHLARSQEHKQAAQV